MTEHTVLTCYSTCWACRFDNHPERSHGWPDLDDRELAEARGLPPEEVEAYMALPCNCTCNPDVYP
jgi:hypothetical protein